MKRSNFCRNNFFSYICSPPRIRAAGIRLRQSSILRQNAELAQLVERRLPKPQVTSSNLAFRSLPRSSSPAPAPRLQTGDFLSFRREVSLHRPPSSGRAPWGFSGGLCPPEPCQLPSFPAPVTPRGAVQGVYAPRNVTAAVVDGNGQARSEPLHRARRSVLAVVAAHRYRAAAVPHVTKYLPAFSRAPCQKSTIFVEKKTNNLSQISHYI